MRKRYNNRLRLSTMKEVALVSEGLRLRLKRAEKVDNMSDQMALLDLMGRVVPLKASLKSL